MEFVDFLLTLVALLILAGVLVLANYVEKNRILYTLMQAILLLLNGIFVAFLGILPLLTAISPPPRTTTPVKIIPVSNALVALVIAVVVGTLASLVLLTPVRQRLAGIFRHRKAEDSSGGFNPESPLHMTALVYCLYLLGNTTLNFALAGGLSGLAQDFNAPSTGELWLQLAIFLLFAALGTGFLMRRRLVDTLRRLGLVGPTIVELLAAAGVAFLLFCAAEVIGILWAVLTPPDMLQSQTQYSELIGSSINTLGMAFLVAITAAIGEEIAFRGALQPIFGLWPTAILFALVHTQYTLTPATLIILIVGLGLGWVRRRYNTTTAVVVHFLYDFGPLVLAIYARYAQDVLRQNIF